MEFEQWFHETYGDSSNTDAIEYGESLDPDVDALPQDVEVRWWMVDIYHLLIASDGQVEKGVLSYWGENARPSLRRLVSCLGPREKYSAWYGAVPYGSGRMLRVDLIYPAQDIVIDSTDFAWRLARANGELLWPGLIQYVEGDELIYLQPAGNRELTRQAVFLDGDPENEDWYLNIVKPWPGSWSKIEVSATPRQY